MLRPFIVTTETMMSVVEHVECDNLSAVIEHIKLCLTDVNNVLICIVIESRGRFKLVRKAEAEF